jgi:hypothetical protein
LATLTPSESAASGFCPAAGSLIQQEGGNRNQNIRPIDQQAVVEQGFTKIGDVTQERDLDRLKTADRFDAPHGHFEQQAGQPQPEQSQADAADALLGL